VIKPIIFILLVSFDLITKIIITNYIDLYQFIPVFFFLDLTHIHNFGISFGLLSGVFSSWLIIIVGLLVVAFIYYLMTGAKETLEKSGLFIIICGALSNIIDRTVNGYVIDYIYFHFNNFSWPAFNFADIYITIGIIMIMVNMLKKINYF